MTMIIHKKVQKSTDIQISNMERQFSSTVQRYPGF